MLLNQQSTSNMLFNMLVFCNMLIFCNKKTVLLWYNQQLHVSIHDNVVSDDSVNKKRTMTMLNGIGGVGASGGASSGRGGMGAP